jgi:hypothetical protein
VTTRVKIEGNRLVFDPDDRGLYSRGIEGKCVKVFKKNDNLIEGED